MMATKKSVRAKAAAGNVASARSPHGNVAIAAHEAFDRALSTGRTIDVGAAHVLEALDFALQDADARVVDQFAGVAREYFAARGLAPSLPLVKQDGAEELCVHLRDLFDESFAKTAVHALTKETALEVAEQLIPLAEQVRPGLRGLRAYHAAASSGVRRKLARGLVEALAVDLKRFTARRKSWDAEDWAEGATRLTLRFLGDPQASNSLKHRDKR